jgi:putative redox protein
MSKEAPPLTVTWQGERRFEGATPGGATMMLDCARQAAPGPVDALLASLASCVAIDVLEILAKRRTPARSLSVRVDHQRADAPPRRLTQVHLRFLVDTDSGAEQVEKAVRLVLDGYCSVASSLDPSIPVTFNVEVADAAAAS